MVVENENENENEKKRYRYEATKSLLIDILKSACGLTILLSRPSGSMYYPEYFFDKGTFDRKKFRRTVNYAQKQGYIEVKEKKEELTITLKELGHSRALKYSIDDIHIPEPIVWDKKWRLVIFDIPENIRPARLIFKDKLDELGFAQIQKSTYVHPFPCHNEIEYIRSLYGLEQYIRLGVLDKLEGDELLRKRFNL
jgi:phenylacetic acid degradation operon negative regulatory protein